MRGRSAAHASITGSFDPLEKVNLVYSSNLNKESSSWVF